MPNALTQWDGNLLMDIQHLVIHDGFTPVMKFITHLGDKGIIWIALIVLMLCFKKTRKVGIIAGTALIVSFVINNLMLKNLVARTRPYDIFTGVQRLVEKQSDWSFPSGHSAASFVTAVVMFRELPRKYGVPALTLAFLIAFSRLYVGVHYPLDVLTGAVSGTLIALLVCWTFKRYNGNKEGLCSGTHR